MSDIPDWTGTNPERATLDHVHELADGGANALENLRLAHACCNESRDRNRRDWKAAA